jgi:hypothetical protein
MLTRWGLHSSVTASTRHHTISVWATTQTLLCPYLRQPVVSMIEAESGNSLRPVGHVASDWNANQFRTGEFIAFTTPQCQVVRLWVTVETSRCAKVPERIYHSTSELKSGYEVRALKATTLGLALGAFRCFNLRTREARSSFFLFTRGPQTGYL